MYLHNIRLGHATNSSSTHSIVYLDDDTASSIYDDDLWDGEFGWGFFTAKSIESKAMYLAITLFSNLRGHVPTSVALASVKEWFDVSLTPTEYGISEYIDHQSELKLPIDYTTNTINTQFLRELKDYIFKENVVILGGNDNTDSEHGLLSMAARPILDLPVDTSRNFVSRKDDLGYWVLFSRDFGTKIRFSFNDPVVPTKASAPELVDLKITDYCTEKCAYCYQNSTPEGQHARLPVVLNILQELSKAEVFEVALGGGAAESHPNFAEIVVTAASLGIVPNFTTKSLSWVKEPWAKDVLTVAGGFAYSVTNHKQLKEYVDTLKEVGYPFAGKNLYIHYVLGSTPFTEYIRILDAARKFSIRVTLLGYKTKGRGANFTAFPHSNWLTHIKDLRKSGKYNYIGIDTAIAQQYASEIKESGISEVLYHSEEGKFSCYIDAVEGTIAPSSYSDNNASMEFNKDWLTTFKTF